MALKKAKKAPGLNLTSMVDIMTLIIIFLIKQMDADGGVVQGGDSLKLPFAASQVSPAEVSLDVQVGLENVMIDHKEVIKTSELRKRVNSGNGADLFIPELKKVMIEKCVEQRALFKVQEDKVNAAVASLQGDERAKLLKQLEDKRAASSKVMLKLDRNIDFGVMLAIMATSGSILEDSTKAEQEPCFPTISFVVEQKSGG